MKKNRTLIIAASMAGLIIVAIFAFHMVIEADPNLFVKAFAKGITIDDAESVSFSRKADGDAASIRTYRFTPDKSAIYRFDITDIKCGRDIIIDLFVLDENMDELLSSNNFTFEGDENSLPDSFSGQAYLQRSHKYYLLFDAHANDNGDEAFEGTFSLAVTESTGEGDTPVLRLPEAVRVRVKANQNKCVLFAPEETGYYRFESTIVSGDAGTGFSVISAITDGDGGRVTVSDGSCYLEAGTEYGIWVTVQETMRKQSRVELTGEKMAYETIGESGVISIEGKTIIEYRPSKKEAVAVYSKSDGDPNVTVSDGDGFRIRYDDNSGASLGNRKKDFAAVFAAAPGKVYLICVDGKFSKCDVYFARYTGDGTSLTKDDIEKGDDDEKGDRHD